MAKWEGTSIEEALSGWMGYMGMREKQQPFWYNLFTPKKNFYKIKSSYVSYLVALKSKKLKNVCPLEVDQSYSLGFFDGDSKGNPRQSKVGGTLYIDQQRWISLRCGLGLASNTKVGLSIIFILLTLAREMGVECVHMVTLCRWFNG
jgi:hypothetical protein